MSRVNNNEIISEACQHTIKKFELIEEYVKRWARILLNNQSCNRIVFIDCMCNSGEYYDKHKCQVFGTAVRVYRALLDISREYPNKQIDVYFNDIKPRKIEHLKTLIDTTETSNFHVNISIKDGNELIKQIGNNLKPYSHYLLVYDPYDAAIDWNAIFPFLNGWCEVIINHMVSDTIRAIRIAKSEEAINKYKKTYLMEFEKLIPYGSDKAVYEQRIEEIIMALRRNKRREYYIAAFPFFSRNNVMLYHLIHCTSNLAGFKLYKEIAWKTFGGKSSIKNTHGQENQFKFDIDGTGYATTLNDEYCYTVYDIVNYLQNIFEGQQKVDKKEIWDVLDKHPVFPSNGFKKQIVKILIQDFGAVEENNRKSISFAPRR